MMNKASLQIKKILKLANKNFDKILDHIGIEYDLENDEIRCACPIHDGDNPTAFHFLKDSCTWRCYTNQCHQQYKNNLFGLVEAYLKKENPSAGFKDVITEITRILKVNLDDLPDVVEKTSEEKFIEKSIRPKLHQTKKNKYNICVPIEKIKKNFVPSEYYLEQGFSPEIIEKYLVQDCHDVKKPMYNRSVFPIFDLENKNMIGASGRTLIEKCQYCKQYHTGGIKKCYGKSYPKWKHWGFNSSEVLYNWKFAQEHISQTKSIFLLEGPKDVMKFADNGVFNTTCVFGLNISSIHIKNFVKSGVQNVILGLDNDDAGLEGKKHIKKSMSLYFNIKDISNILEFGEDFADLPNDKFKDILTSKARNYCHV